MFSFKSTYFVVFTLILYKSQAEISDKRLCIDKNCSVLIAIGKTLLKYSSPETNVLSFGVNEHVKVYSYGAGTRSELVGVEINGKRGYINSKHFRETNLYKRPTLLVNTEIGGNAPGVSIEHVDADEIKADSTQQPFEIVDGTRIPLDVVSFSTEAPVVNVVGDQSSEETTKPLDSVPVPDIQDLNAAPKQVDVVNTDQPKIIEDPPQQQEPTNNDDEDSDDDGDDDSDDADVEDDEVDEENKVDQKTDAATNDIPTDAVEPDFPSENPGIIASDTQSHNEDDANVNAPNNNLKGAANLEQSTDLVNEGINVKNTNEGAKNKDIISPDNVPNEKHEESTFKKASIAAELTETLKIEIAQTSPKEAEGGKINLGGSVPLEKLVNSINENVTDPANAALKEQHEVKTSPTEADGDEGSVPREKLVNSITQPEVNEFNREASEESNNGNLKVDVENSDTDNAENSKKESDILANMLYQTKEPKSSEEPPLSSTQPTLDMEIIPAYLDFVTPDPNSASSQGIDDLDKENSNNSTDGVPSPLPGDSTSEFKDPEEGADIQAEVKPAGGLFGGLGAILPMFNTGGDRKVDEIHNPSPNQENGDPEENVDPKQQPADFSFTDDVKPSDPSEHLNPEQLLQNNEPVAWENISDITTEQNEVPPTLNSDASSAQISIEETESPNVDISLESQEGGILSNLMSFFSGKKSEEVAKGHESQNELKEDSHATAAGDIFNPETQELNDDLDSNAHNPWSSNNPLKENENNKEFCDKDSCPKEQEVEDNQDSMSKSHVLSAEDLQILFIEAFSSDLFLYLTTTALSVIFMVFGMVILDKCRREGPLIARINNLEQRLMTTIKENELLQEKSASLVEEQTQLVVETVPNEAVEQLTQQLAHMHEIKLALEDQIVALERELDTSTEVGTELNKIISEMLNSSDGSEIIRENIEQMQKKLFEQQDTISSVNETLSLKETENHELRLEMAINNGKVTDLQSELDRLVEKIVKIEDERDQQHSVLENEILVYQAKCKEALSKEEVLNSEIQMLKQQLTKFQRISEVKVKEYNTLKESLNEIKAAKNNKDVLKSLLEVSEIKAQLEQFKSENMKYSEQLTQGREANLAYGTEIENLTKEVSELREKYQKADKEKVEVNTKLQVLNNYFKEKEDQMQKEISKYESLWAVKEGEATSTTERIRHMQDELQNYKSQNESLKQEIVNQEVELKSQISMLEKKAHESWVANRQTERKLEEARQEAAQLRNRLTLRERAIADGNNQNRMQSPLHQNGELPMSPPPLDPTQSPPPLFNPRDHLAKSPPIPGLPPFLPPPLGATPFIPPPPLDGMMPPLGELGGMPPPHFMPPLPPGMYPGDHRPPPLGRMSSPPPVGGRYSPESTVYSDYDRYSRRSPSPPYDSEYGASPPPIRGYSPYQDRLRDDRREYKRPQARSNGRNSKGIHSSGSENDSLGKTNKKSQRKV